MTTKQRRWQHRQKAAGKCVICGAVRGDEGTEAYCRKHADEQAQRQLRRYHRKKLENERERSHETNR